MGDARFFANANRMGNFEEAYNFCKERQILKRDAPQCPTCEREMTLVKNTSYKIDGVVFRCPTHKARKKSIRSGSYFEDSRLSLEMLLKLALVWAYQLPVTTAMEMSGVASEAAVQWFQYYRDVCTEWLLHNPIQLGGEGRIVEIDKSVIARRKYHRGHRVPERWIFGMFDRTQKIGMVEFVPDRSANTLLPIIQRHVRPGTAIYSDQWAAYNGIGNIAVNPPYIHSTVNHNVEGFWNNCKRSFKKMSGTTEEMLASHLDEFLWRQFHGESKAHAFDNLLLHLSHWYQV